MSVRVSATDRIRIKIDALFAEDRELPEILEEVARLGAQLLVQAALEAEATEFLGRQRYQRSAACPDANEGSEPSIRRVRAADSTRSCWNTCFGCLVLSDASWVAGRAGVGRLGHHHRGQTGVRRIVTWDRRVHRRVGRFPDRSARTRPWYSAADRLRRRQRPERGYRTNLPNSFASEMSYSSTLKRAR